MTSIRLLADEPLRCRCRLLTIRRLFARGSSAVLLLDGSEPDLALAEPVQDVLRLGRMASEDGDVRRRLSTAKMRGMAFNRGCHNARA